jgi:hypothetical protein
MELSKNEPSASGTSTATPVVAREAPCGGDIRFGMGLSSMHPGGGDCNRRASCSY